LLDESSDVSNDSDDTDVRRDQTRQVRFEQLVDL
ncbi:MAG: hypothetical protein A07HR60_00338, partial [uncultured archaeon A07HR60]